MLKSCQLLQNLYNLKVIYIYMVLRYGESTTNTSIKIMYYNPLNLLLCV